MFGGSTIPSAGAFRYGLFAVVSVPRKDMCSGHECGEDGSPHCDPGR